MTPTARSIVIFGWYVAVVGIWLLVTPNSLLDLFGIEETTEIWIRVLGALAVVVSYYYLEAGRRGDLGFFSNTVYARVGFALLLVILALAYGPWQLLLFAAVDVGGALWTLTALRKPT